MKEFIHFTWCGEPIQDIHQWAKDRGERMIQYRHTYHDPMGDSVFEGEMPQHFWDHLCMNGIEEWEELS